MRDMLWVRVARNGESVVGSLLRATGKHGKGRKVVARFSATTELEARRQLKAFDVDKRHVRMLLDAARSYWTRGT